MTTKTNSAPIRGIITLLSCDSTEMPIVSTSVSIDRSGMLKFLVGLDQCDRLLIVFDERHDLHDELAKLHELRPLGGGWLEIDLPRKMWRMGGSSLAFGQEPDRQLTARMFSKAMPDFALW